jgi:hypothetical protein
VKPEGLETAPPFTWKKKFPNVEKLVDSYGDSAYYLSRQMGDRQWNGLSEI